MIEHNLDVIKTADYIIDIGPEGGDKGGTVVAQGTPEEVAQSPVSYTGKYVKKISEIILKSYCRTFFLNGSCILIEEIIYSNSRK